MLTGSVAAFRPARDRPAAALTGAARRRAPPAPSTRRHHVDLGAGCGVTSTVVGVAAGSASAGTDAGGVAASSASASHCNARRRAATSNGRST